MTIELVRTTLSPIGHRMNGSPIWPVFGAAPEGDGDGGDGGEGGDDDGDGGDDGSGGDGGSSGSESLEAQLAAEKKANERLRKSLKPFSQLRRTTGLSVQEMQERLSGGSGSTGSNSSNSGQSGESGSQGQQQQPPVDVDAIRREERRAAQEKSDTRYRKMAVKAAAGSLLNDPDDALRYLDLSSYEVDDDGEIDERMIQRDLKSLIEDRPYLAKKQKAPDFEGGPRGGTAKGANMNDLVRRQAGIIR
jgi:hypothetical protein